MAVTTCLTISTISRGGVKINVSCYMIKPDFWSCCKMVSARLAPVCLTPVYMWNHFPYRNARPHLDCELKWEKPLSHLTKYAGYVPGHSLSTVRHSSFSVCWLAGGAAHFDRLQHGVLTSWQFTNCTTCFIFPSSIPRRQPWRNLPPLNPILFPSLFLSPFLTGVRGVSSRENFGIKDACLWVLERA